MSMFVKLKDRVINLAHVAVVERNANGTLTVHYSIPKPGVVPMSGPPTATDHHIDIIHGSDADELWKQLQAL
jgi:hypothetical protein